MCAINPTHKKRYLIDVYTSENIDVEEFESYAATCILNAEMLLNMDGKLRFHVKETDQQAD